MDEITIIGLDLAKRVFQAHGPIAMAEWASVAEAWQRVRIRRAKQRNGLLMLALR